MIKSKTATARPYRGNTAEARRLERRTKLLDAAGQVFGERGFHSATVKSICDAAGLTERYFYESFCNNEALFVAMHRRTSDRIIAALSNALNEGDTSDQKIRAVLLTYYSDIVDDPVSARLFAVDAGFISPAAKKVCDSWRSSFGQILVQAVGGLLRDSSPLLRSGVVRALLGLGVDWMEAGFADPQEEIVETGVCLSAVLKPR